MRFKSKLALAFSSVLALTVIVAVTNWWGLGNVIHKQQQIEYITSKIDQIFREITDVEQHYRLTRAPEDTQSLKIRVQQLRQQLKALPLNEKREGSPSHQRLFTELGRYESSFLRSSSSAIAMRTMKSRMTKESERLLENAQNLVDRTIASEQRVPASHLAYRVSIILVKGNSFLLEASPTQLVSLMNASESLLQFTDSSLNMMTQDIQKLGIYRIQKAVTIYREIISSYFQEKQMLDEAEASMKKAHNSFAQTLESYLAVQQKRNQKSITTLQSISVLISMAAIVLGIAAVMFLSNMITRPINELKKSAKNIVDGNLDTFVINTSSDDIGELGSIFNQMTAQLKKSFSELEEYRQHLESQVTIRTEKLQSEIEQRMQTEEKLRTSSERLSNIFERSPMGIVVFNENFKIIEWNPGCKRIFGYTRDEIIGSPGAKIVPEDLQDSVAQVYKSLLGTKKSAKNQNENLTRDGRRILCEWYNTPLTDATNNTVGMLSLVEDITEKIHTEKELLKVKKLESTGVLAGGIAHDFNNLLTAILGSINLVMLDETLSSRSKQLISSAEKASQRAQTLTQQLLTFAKGGAPLREQTSLPELIMDSADFILSGSSTSVNYTLPDDLWYIDADKGQISQVIQNIVLNASQVMSDGGGNLCITCENLSKEHAALDPLLDERAYLKLTIADNGEGMSQQVLERIFDPYFSTKTGGSGLGLAITFSIVRKHNGYIKVESTPNCGTTFTIFLPAASGQAVLKYPEQNNKTAHKSATILLMDDEQIILDVAGEMIRTLGHTAYVSKNGDECLQLYKKMLENGSPPDLVIMDLTIPGGKGGEETFAELQAIHPEIKAIVSSGYSNNPLMSTFREAGFFGSIPKPYVATELNRAIREALQSSET